MANQVPEIKWASPTETIVFMHNGEHIKSSINRKIEEQLKPRYVSYMNRIRNALKDPEGTKEEDSGMSAAALVMAFFAKERSNDAEWLRFLAKQAAETLEIIDRLRAIDRSILINALYTIDQKQAKEFGV
jgi:hypothetical protein